MLRAKCLRSHIGRASDEYRVRDKLYIAVVVATSYWHKIAALCGNYVYQYIVCIMLWLWFDARSQKEL